MSDLSFTNKRGGPGMWCAPARRISPGGFKNSGIDSVLAYTELKTVWINLSQAPMPDPFVMR